MPSVSPLETQWTACLTRTSMRRQSRGADGLILSCMRKRHRLAVQRQAHPLWTILVSNGDTYGPKWPDMAAYVTRSFIGRYVNGTVSWIRIPPLHVRGANHADPSQSVSNGDTATSEGWLESRNATKKRSQRRNVHRPCAEMSNTAMPRSAGISICGENCLKCKHRCSGPSGTASVRGKKHHQTPS